MNVNDFYQDLKNRVEVLLPTYRIFAEKVDSDWKQTLIMNVSDAMRSPDSNVEMIECEFIFTDDKYSDLTRDTKIVLDGIHGFRGLFPTVGGDTRAVVHESIQGVKIREDRTEGKTIDLPHLRFVAKFFIEDGVGSKPSNPSFALIGENVSDALTTLYKQLSPIESGGLATNLSALNFNNASAVPYWRGSDVTSYERFETKKSNPWQRFYEELWESPVKNFIGTTSTGVVFILPTGTEADGENDINNGMRYMRSIPVEVIALWLDEGAPDEYERLSNALLKDALQDPTLGNNITFFRWNALERLRPRGIGVAGCRLAFTMDYSIAVP